MLYIFFSPLEQFEINNFFFSYFSLKFNIMLLEWNLWQNIILFQDSKLYLFKNQGDPFFLIQTLILPLTFIKKLYIFLNFFFFTNIFFSFFTFIFIFIFFFSNINNDNYLFPKTFLYYIILFIYNLIIKLINDQIQAKIKYNYVKLLTLIFIFLSLNNFLSILPYSFATTGQFIITLSLAFNLFFWMNIIGIYTLRFQFFNIFLPTGTPFFIAPFVMLIEIISYFARLFSLSIRLFANIMAGHTLIKILVFFTWLMIFKFGIWIYVSLLLLFIIFLITLLEIGISLVQSYIFCTLVVIYLNTYFENH